ncbi:MAG TPA: response regulator, partial [Trueperaceae bacterium]|nr:response regulator [Trueperaceae bacterium]
MPVGGVKRHLVLVAEDSRTEAEGLRLLLEREGYEVVWAADGRQALELAREQRPAVIISDIVMPELDGYGLCRAVKDDPGLADVPVMLVTTLSEPSDVIRGLEAGADHFIRKPYRSRYLLSRLNYLLANRALRDDQRMQMGIELRLGGKTHFINAQRQQILDLLISTFEQAVDLNAELVRKQREVTQANLVLARLYGLARALNQAASTSEVVAVARQRLAEIPGVEAVEVTLLDRAGAGGAEARGEGADPAAAAAEAARVEAQPGPGGVGVT